MRRLTKLLPVLCLLTAAGACGSDALDLIDARSFSDLLRSGLGDAIALVFFGVLSAVFKLWK